ncbi:MAG TPA: amidohydrolase family protein [Thermoanaerobaculia bacterium]|jgi:predicted TIM-barrel fold metal-dependent hydrolase
MQVRPFCASLLLLFAACTHTAAPPAASTAPSALAGPLADHHQHLLSPAGAAWISDPLLPAATVPDDVARLLAARAEKWNDKAGLAALYTEDSYILDRYGSWTHGRDAVADYISTVFARAYRITPVSYDGQGDRARIVGYFTRGEGESLKHFGHVQLALDRGSDGQWRIAAETPVFPGPNVRTTLGAAERIPQLEAAGIKYAAILSSAYWYGSPLRPPQEHEYDKVRAENDWTIAEVAKYPDRLAAFCSFNPLKDYAVQELERCAQNPLVRGIKLHFGNSGIDMLNAEHVAKLQRVFRAANEHHLAIVAHLWTGNEYGAEHAEAFLNRLLPQAPDVPVQIAHFAGGGPGYTDEALEVYAKAIQAHDARTKHLYFDVATVADGQKPEVLAKFAERIRQVGLDRVFFGTDLGPPEPRQSWLTFRTTVPLTDQEFRTIAANIAPYFRR